MYHIKGEWDSQSNLTYASIYLLELRRRYVSYWRLGSPMSCRTQTNNIPETVPEVSAEIKSEIMSFFPVGN